MVPNRDVEKLNFEYLPESLHGRGGEKLRSRGRDGIVGLRI